MINFIVWLVPALLITFVVLPWQIAYRKQGFVQDRYHNDHSVSDVLFPGIPAAIFWPVTLGLGILYITMWIPVRWTFNQSINMFMPKPPKPIVPKELPKVDETK